MPRVLVQLLCQVDRAGARHHLAEDTNPPLGLGDDLVRHHEHVAVADRARRAGDESGEVIARLDLGQTLDGYGAQHLMAPSALSPGPHQLAQHAARVRCAAVRADQPSAQGL